jgi:hypothetical protein
MYTFALMKEPTVVPQIWHTFFNTLIGPVLSLSLFYLFDGFFNCCKVKKRRAFDTKQYAKNKKRYDLPDVSFLKKADDENKKNEHDVQKENENQNKVQGG